MDKKIKNIHYSTRYSFLNILTGSDLSRRRLALMETKSVNPGPVVWLTACVHGDEVGGIVIIQEIFKSLKKTPLKKGELYAFPLMNPIGFETVSRHIGLNNEDLNRSFPGNPIGSVAERIADKIFSTIIRTKPSLVIDLHNDWIKSVPYVLLDPCPDKKRSHAYEHALKYSKQSGFLIINEQEDGISSYELSKTLSGSLLNQNIPAITFELGESYAVNEKIVEDGFTSIKNILANLGMTDPSGNQLNHGMMEVCRDKILNYSHMPIASKSGIIRFLVKPGQIIKQGDKIAKIYNVFGKLQETVTAHKNSIVLGLSDTSVAMPGMPVAAFGNF